MSVAKSIDTFLGNHKWIIIFSLVFAMLPNRNDVFYLENDARIAEARNIMRNNSSIEIIEKLYGIKGLYKKELDKVIKNELNNLHFKIRKYENTGERDLFLNYRFVEEKNILERGMNFINYKLIEHKI